MNLTIRKIESSDLPSIIALLRDFAAFENLSEYCTATEERFHAAMFGENAFVEGLIVLDDQKPIGYSLIHPSFSSFRGQQGIYLEDVYVDATYRGSGVGELLLKAVARLACDRGFERIDFQVLDCNVNAIKFYKKLGAESNDNETHFKFSDDAFQRLAS